MPIRIRRPLYRGWSAWSHLTYPYDHARPIGGGQTNLAPGPGGGPVGPMPNGTSYNGLDPSDPTTWAVRQYNPVAGMIGGLNFDGAMVNITQAGPNPGPRR